MEMEINRDCPFCGNILETIDHLHRQYSFTKEVLSPH